MSAGKVIQYPQNKAQTFTYFWKIVAFLKVANSFSVLVFLYFIFNFNDHTGIWGILDV